MGAFIDSAKAGLLAYKLAILRGVLFSTNTLVLCFLAAVYKVDFMALPHWQQFVIVLTVCGNWGNTILAYLDNTIHTLKSEPPK